MALKFLNVVNVCIWAKGNLVVPIAKLSIIVTVAFSYICLKKKLTKKSFLGLLFIVTGTLVLLL